jgi:hypothetical protein
MRKAIIAATIGTAIEWYDFFIYGTATGLIFGKLYWRATDGVFRQPVVHLRQPASLR